MEKGAAKPDVTADQPQDGVPVPAAKVAAGNKEDTRFDAAAVVLRLAEISKNYDSVSGQTFIDLCLSLTKFSSSLGKLIAWGFQGTSPTEPAVLVDIFAKCAILADQLKRHPECHTLQQLITKEMGLNIHVLSGSNNAKHGHPKGTQYGTYESGIVPK